MSHNQNNDIMKPTDYIEWDNLKNILSRVQPGKNRTAKAAQDFSWTELAQPLTAPECGVTFADRKEKRRTYVNTTKHKDTFFNTQEKPSYPFLTSNLPVFSFPYCFLSFSGSTEPRFLPG